MKCVVSAGPTYEPLDEARRITNMSTGRLGSELATFLSDLGHEVTLLLGEQAPWKGTVRAARMETFTTGSDLARKLERLAGEPVHAVFHAAAVSDFAFGQVWRQGEDGTLRPVSSSKFSTREGPLLVELTPTPKIIARLRSWFPKALLVGWKYEVTGERNSAVIASRELMDSNKLDACVANGPAYGKGFGLLNRNGTLAELEDSQSLFAMLSNLLSLSR